MKAQHGAIVSHSRAIEDHPEAMDAHPEGMEAGLVMIEAHNSSRYA
jgi:hypothetical protein